MKRVIIAGSRHLPFEQNETFIKTWLKTAFELFKPEVVVCGKAKGIDTLGAQFALEREIKVEYYPADWNTHGKAAGHIRNEEMAKNADTLWLIWDGKSPGSNSMRRLALQHNLEVLEYIL